MSFTCLITSPKMTPFQKKPSQNKDLNKVEKKYLYPHGVCPPLKNCRKRRFRKVLRKNYVEAPELEKEVRHLLRIDNEAVDVKWELVRAFSGIQMTPNCFLCKACAILFPDIKRQGVRLAVTPFV